MRRWLLLLLACCTALVVRLVFVSVTASDGPGMVAHYVGLADMMSSGYGFNRVHIDEWKEYRRAMRRHSRELASEGRQLDASTRLPLPSPLLPEFYRNPVYPAFLHGVYRAFGEPIERNARIVQSLLTAVYPLLVFALALMLFERTGPALLAAWLTALHPALAYLDGSLLADGFASLLLLAAVVAVVAGVRSQRLRWFLLAGLLLGAAAHLRSTLMYSWVFLGAALFVALPRWSLPAKATALVAVCLHLVLLPWALRNHRLTGEWMWGTTRGGATLWESAGQFPNPWGMKLLDAAARARAQAAGFESEMTPEADAWFMEQVKSAVREDPLFFVVAAFKRLPWIFAPPYLIGYDNPNRTMGMITHFVNEKGLSPWQVLIRHPGYVLAAFWERALVMLLGAAGALSALWLAASRLRTRPWAVALFLAIPVFLVAFHAITHVTPRYLAPLIPYQMIGIAFVVSDLRGRLRAREVPHLASEGEREAAGSEREAAARS
jgi:4-amino-4-deoxy-L-arabinose transferase-like glycosyltransferase